MLQWIDKVPPIFLILAAWMTIAPLRPKPHLVEKIQMLAAGTLTRPIDIFDFLMHGAFALFLVVKLARMVLVKS